MKFEQIRDFQKVCHRISKNITSKTWPCLFNSCVQPSINSHLLQKNGVLNLITQDQHLIEIKMTDIFRWNEDSPPLQFKRIGIKNALSLKVFCKQHDTILFKPAETPPVDFHSYSVNMLLSYRAICAEIRKKQQSMEFQSQLLNAKLISTIISRSYIEFFLEGLERGIADLNFYKDKLEKEFTGNIKGFEFKVFTYPLIKVYCSAGFNIYESSNTPFQEKPLKYVLIHIVPTQDSLKIIVGYHRDQSKKSILDFVDSWEGLTMTKLELKLTNLFATRIENWGMSPEIYRSLDIQTEKAFIKYFDENTINHLQDQDIDFNLFEGKNYGKL